MSGRFDEGLDEHGRGVVVLCPVLGQTPPDDGQDVRTEVGDDDPRQHEETPVIDHKGGVFSPFCSVHPMKLSRGASFQAAVLKPSMPTGRPSRG